MKFCVLIRALSIHILTSATPSLILLGSIFHYADENTILLSLSISRFAEIRAAREAECNKFFTFQWMREACIKDHAIASTENLYTNSKVCVNRVFTKAMADNAPFDKIYGPAPKPK